jgi:D-glycero-D-manno-heptose 1,7-bisphosphate phosphatase
MIKCFFFDRDGVLIKNYGYVYKNKNLKWLKGSVEAIQFLNQIGVKVIVITNQSGIARGYFSEDDMKKFHKFMNNILSTKVSKIDDFFYCPYHPSGNIKKYKKKTNLRKPGNGMLLKAMKKYKLKTSECFMIGDQKADFYQRIKQKFYFNIKKKYLWMNKLKK